MWSFHGVRSFNFLGPKHFVRMKMNPQRKGSITNHPLYHFAALLYDKLSPYLSEIQAHIKSNISSRTYFEIVQLLNSCRNVTSEEESGRRCCDSSNNRRMFSASRSVSVSVNTEKRTHTVLFLWHFKKRRTMGKKDVGYISIVSLTSPSLMSLSDPLNVQTIRFHVSG